MIYDEVFIEQLKSRNDIVEVVSAYCHLEQKGVNYWACCPLPGHMEKTPSFSVNPAGQFFKCYGCGLGGDVIKFISLIENLEFVDSVKFLADRCNMELPEIKNVDKEANIENKRKKERAYALMREAAMFYVKNLYSEKGEPYRNYLEKRGISRDVAREFGLGASLDYTSLPKHLKSLGYEYNEMLECGAVSYNEERKEYLDFEAKRLIVPIIDNYGTVIAFGGRVLEKVDFGKYKNTKETFLFKKNRTLYGLNNLKKQMRMGRLDYIIMVEGYMDAIALSSAGFKNVVASMGTSLTEMQAKMLLRYSDTAVISYDGDSAGQNATLRGLELLKTAGLTVKVVCLPDELDPDDVIRKQGKDAYKKLIDNSLPLVDYKLESYKNKSDLKSTEGKRKYISGALKIIAESEQAFEREELLKKISQASGLTYESLKRDLDRLTGGGATQQEFVPNVENRETPKAEISAERYVLCSTIKNKSFASVENLIDIDFSNETRKTVIDYIIEKFYKGEKVIAQTLSEVVGENGIAELDLILNSDEFIDEDNKEKYYQDCLHTLENKMITLEMNELNRMFEAENDEEVRRIYSQRIQKLTEKLNDKNGGLK